MDSYPSDLKYKLYIRLLTSNQRRIYHFIYAMVPNYSVCDDIMQETTLFMWEHFDQFKESSNFTAWGISIARNMVLQHCRKQRENKRIFSFETMENLISQSDVFDSRDDVAEALRYCLKKLDSRQRELLEMRYYQGNSIRTIAERVDQVTSHLYRVMANIHKSLLRCINIRLLS